MPHRNGALRNSSRHTVNRLSTAHVQLPLAATAFLRPAVSCAPSAGREQLTRDQLLPSPPHVRHQLASVPVAAHALAPMHAARCTFERSARAVVLFFAPRLCSLPHGASFLIAPTFAVRLHLCATASALLPAATSPSFALSPVPVVLFALRGSLLRQSNHFAPPIALNSSADTRPCHSQLCACRGVRLLRLSDSRPVPKTSPLHASLCQARSQGLVL
eukprot:5741795-Pleurochrysis_carterae.AAC.2